MAGALNERVGHRRAAGVHRGVRGRHHRRLDFGRRRVRRFSQVEHCQSGDVRTRHRGSREKLPGGVFAGRVRASRENRHTGCGDIRFQNVSAISHQRATRRESRNLRRRRRDARRVAGREGHRRAGGRGVGQHRIVELCVEVDGGHAVSVEVDRSGDHVHQDHSHAARPGDLGGLSDTGVGSALAHHDVAGDEGRIEGVGETEIGTRRAGECHRCCGYEGRREDGGRRVEVDRHRRAGVGDAGTECGGCLVAGDGGGGHRGVPRRAVVGGGCCRAVVTGRDRHEYAGSCGTKERLIGGAHRRRRRSASDGEVDHVDAVSHRGLDGRERVGRGASVIVARGRIGARPADLVGRDLGCRSDAADGAEVLAAGAGLDGIVADCGRAGVRAVTVAVAGRRELAVSDGAEVGRAEPVEEVPRSDNLRRAVGGRELRAGLAGTGEGAAVSLLEARDPGRGVERCSARGGAQRFARE